MSSPTKLILLLAGVLAIGLSGCDLRQRDKDTVIKVSPEFTVEMYEQASNPDSLRVVVKTIDEQSCLNNTIRFDASRFGSKLFLSILEIAQAIDCVPGDERIHANAEFGNLANGHYNFQIDLKNTIKNAGYLEVTDDVYRLDFEDPNGFEIVEMELRRVPNNHVWGYVAYEDEAVSGQSAQDFLAELATATTQRALVTGDYSEFIVDVDQKLILKSTPDQPFFKTFYAQANNLTLLAEIANFYRNPPLGTGLTIKLVTWDGKNL
jgi:hypothetical protein